MHFKETWICSLYPVWMVLMTLWCDTHSQNTLNTGTQHIKREFDKTMEPQVTFQVAPKPLNRSQNHLEVKITAETKREKLDNLLVQSEMTFCVCVCVNVCSRREWEVSVGACSGSSYYVYLLSHVLFAVFPKPHKVLMTSVVKCSLVETVSIT